MLQPSCIGSSCILSVKGSIGLGLKKIIISGTDDLKKQLNKTIWGAKLGGSLWIQDQPGLQSKSQEILGYTVRPHLK